MNKGNAGHNPDTRVGFKVKNEIFLPAKWMVMRDWADMHTQVH